MHLEFKILGISYTTFIYYLCHGTLPEPSTQLLKACHYPGQGTNVWTSERGCGNTRIEGETDMDQQQSSLLGKDAANSSTI